MANRPIHTLSAAVVSTAPGVRGNALYVGWTEEGLPAATHRQDWLSEEARASLQAYRASGLSVRKLPFAELVPVIYTLTGPVVDFADTGGRIAEDQVLFTFADAAGERRDIPLGELGLLRGIVLARNPWQAPRPASRGGIAVSAVPMYTVFSTIPGADERTGLAILFEPTVAGETNEPAFRSFVRNSIGRLLVLDESQPAGSRRGYLEVAGRVAGVPPSGGMLGTLVSLRRLGFVEFDDDWLRRAQRRGRKMKGGFIRALAAAGLVEIDGQLLDELRDPRPDYDVDKLSTDELIDMAEEMFLIARRVLG